VRFHKLFLVFLLAFGPSTTAKADDDPRALARVHYERGLGLVENGAYEAALVEFNQAYEKSPHFAVLYNVGLCEVALGHPLKALDALSKYLEEGGEQVPVARRQQVEAQIAELASRLAELQITTDRPGARILVDGREIGRTPLAKPVRVTPGAHDISAVFEGAPTATRSIEVREAERRAIVFTFAPAPAASPAPLLPSPAPREPPQPVRRDEPVRRADPKSSGPWRTVGYVLTGAGVAVAAGGVGHYLWNQGRHDDWESEQAKLKKGPTSPSYHDLVVANNERADSIEGASGVTVGLFVASGALLAGGITLIVVDPGSEASVAWSGTW
jgi:tetratricopeptide (TPR) repeat protein